MGVGCVPLAAAGAGAVHPASIRTVALSADGACFIGGACAWQRSQSSKPQGRRIVMWKATSTGAIALAATLMMSMGVALAADEGKYPDWRRAGGGFGGRGVGGARSFDPTKHWGFGQLAALRSRQINGSGR